MKRTLLAAILLVANVALAAEGVEQDYLARSAIAEQWFFRDLPRHLGNDVKETFWNPWHLAGLAAGAGLTAVIHEADPEIQGKFHPGDAMGGAKDVLNLMGNSLVLGGSTLLATVIAKAADAPKATWTAGTMLESLAVTYAFTYALKFATQRRRPDGSNDLSFPSGHASGSFALATVAEVCYGPWVGVPSYALAGAIALSRIDANKHVASDTVAGALLGTLVGLGTAKFHKREKPDLFVMPVVLESGVGLGIGGDL